MLRHLFKLVWNRKRTSALLIFEIFCSFLVLTVVTTLCIFLYDNYRRPLGFDFRDIWTVRVATSATEYENPESAEGELLERVAREARSFDEVVEAACASGSPYDTSQSISSWDRDGGGVVRTEVGWATDEYAKVMGLELISGRWFEPADAARPWEAIVIDRDLATDVFGAEDPVGKKLPDRDRGEGSRVIGVVAEFRKDGELSAPGNFLFRRARLDGRGQFPPRTLLLKMRPGTPAAFEQQLAERLQAVAPHWTFEISQLARLRERSFRMQLAPVIGGAVIAGFLVAMVALGLVGVLWQNVTQRTREFGLRRAIGASGRDVRRQVLIELMLMTSLGCALGAIVAVQIPILNLLTFLSARVFGLGLVASAAAIYAVAALCGLYPSWLATRVQPVEALHYE